jgi:NAD+ diphosphatase
MEEVGLHVDDVAIVGSQPWPIGRGGSCELMIGAIATAAGTDIQLNAGEV